MTTSTTPRTLAAAVEAADDETKALWEKYQSLPQDVKEAFDEMVEYDQRQKARIKALEAFVGKLAAYQPQTTKDNYYHGKDAAYREVAEAARALLSATSGENTDTQGVNDE